MPTSLGRTAIVTGGASGIGFAVTERLLVDGYDVVVLDRARAPLPLGAVLVEGDQRDEVAWGRVVVACRDSFGRSPSALVLNAATGGGGGGGDLGTVSISTWREVFEVNVTGSVIGLQTCLPLMVEQGSGAIVIMSSVDGLLAEQGTTAYACSKAALLQLGRCVAVDYARNGIRINTVCPGIVETAGFRGHLATATDPVRFEAYRRERTPFERFLDPSEIAGAVSFLLGPDASGMTGSALVVDAGLTASYDFRTGREGA